MDYNYTMAINQDAPKPPLKNAAVPEKPVAAPVLGWLVCVEGPQIGWDAPIFKGVTQVAKHMDIDPNAIGCQDEKIRLVISYDAGSNTFSARQEGECNVELNGAPLSLRQQNIKAYDVIRLPGTRLMFIPFCEDSRKWD